MYICHTDTAALQVLKCKEEDVGTMFSNVTKTRLRTRPSPSYKDFKITNTLMMNTSYKNIYLS